MYELDWTPCNRFTSYELHWLNSLGGFDTWVFDKRSRYTDENTTSGYTQIPNVISGTSIARTSSEIRRGQYQANIETVYTVNTGILKDWELDGLSDLMTSPQVYWNSPDWGYVQVEIVTAPFEYKRQQWDKNFNQEVQFRIMNQDGRQKL